MMLKLHVVSFEVVTLCCVIGGASILTEHPYTDNTDTVPLQKRLQGAVPNMTATTHLCLLLCFFSHRKFIFYFGAFFGSV
jgi:hypothetical protein